MVGEIMESQHQQALEKTTWDIHHQRPQSQTHALVDEGRRNVSLFSV